MQTQDHKKISSSGNEGHGVHVCHKCGWPFPNPHPSSRHRRAHKKHCGTIEGYKLGNSGENKTDLDVSDDDSKTPSLKDVEKVPEMSIARKSSSGVGSRSSRSTRSDEDVFSDAVADFSDVPAVVDTVVVNETVNVTQELSKDVVVTQLDVEKVDAGDLYPPNTDNSTQLENVGLSRPENEKLEIDMPSQQHLTASVDSISNSGLSVPEGSVSESTLQSSKTDINFDSDEKVNLKALVDEKSEDIVIIHAENAGKTSEAIVLSQKVDGDVIEIVPASVSAVGELVNEFADNNDCANKVNFAREISLDKETVEVEKSEDIMIIPAELADKTSEAVSVTQMVNGDNIELLPANAAVEVIGKQDDEFDVKNDCFPKADFVEQIESIEADSNVEAGIKSIDDVVVPVALPLKEKSEGVFEDHEVHENEKLPEAVSLDLAQEVEFVEHDEDNVNREDISSVLLVEPRESVIKNCKDIMTEVLHQEDDSAENVSVDKKMEMTETQTANAEDNNDNKFGQGKMVTSPQENPVVFVDTNLQSVLDDSGNLAHPIEGFKAVGDDSKRDRKYAQIFDALEADDSMVEEEKVPLTSDSVDYDVKSREVEEKVSGFTPTVAQFDDQMDNKVEVQRVDEHESEAEVKDLGSSSNQTVGGEYVDLLGTTVILDISNDGNKTEQTQNEEFSGHKASDSVEVSHLSNVMTNDSQLDVNEVFKDVKEVENFGEKERGEGKVDLGLISDNDDIIDVARNTTNKNEAEGPVEDRLTDEKDGSDFDFANGIGNLVKQEAAVSELDVQVDSVSQTDSLEGNWGSVTSVSVLSAFSDAPAAIETGSQRSQSSVKVETLSLQPKSNNGESDIFKPPYAMTSAEQKGGVSGQNEGASEAQTQSVTPETLEASSSKKNEEIIAKVTNWSTSSTGKQHMPLKSFLGESSPNVKENPPFGSGATEKTIVNAKELADEAAKGEMKKEWSSPARYPTNIKREKGKVKSKPYWAPFICCSSVQTS